MTTKSKRGTDYSQLLIWSAVLVTVARYAGAFVASDVGELKGWASEALTVSMLLSGLGMGVLDVLGGAYLFDGWRRVMPKSGERWPFRFRVLTVFVFGLILVGIGILIPFTVSRVSHKPMLETLGNLVWLWSALVNVAPYLLIGGVATANTGIVSAGGGQLTGQMSEGGGQMSGQNSGTYPSDWRKLKKLLTPEQIKELAILSTEAICYKYGIEDRQARRWRESAGKEVKKTKVPA